MSKKMLIIVALIAVMVVSVGAAAAQGNGNGDNDCLLQAGDCVPNAYNNSGTGFGNARGGNRGQQRGQMNQGTGRNGTGIYANLPPASTNELPDDIAALMIDGWSDEQNALAVYQSVIAQFGDVAPFVNIIRAEAQHSAAWEYMFNRYGIAVPEPPAFDVPQVASVTEACQLAADAEIANFGLYDDMLDAFSAYPDLYQVALSLRNASEFSHLPAFQACAGS